MSAICWSGMSFEKGFSGCDEIRSVIVVVSVWEVKDLRESHTVLGIVQSCALADIYGHDRVESTVKGVKFWVSIVDGC